MAFLVNFRLRSDSDRPQSEASPTENGACAFKVKSAVSQKAFHFSTTKSLGERYLSGFSEGLGRCGQSPARRGALGRPRCPEPAPRRTAGAHRARPDSPLLGCGDSVETEVWPMSRVAGPAPAITRLFRSLDHGSARRQSSKRSFPSRCGGARRVPSPSPLRGSPSPAGRSGRGGSCPADACHSSMQISWGQGSRGRREGEWATGAVE